MSQKVRRLRQPRWNRVDLVHMGANYDPASGEGSHVVLFKAAPEPPKPVVVGEAGPEVIVPRAKGGIINPSQTWVISNGVPPFTYASGTTANITLGLTPKDDAAAQPAGGATITPKASAESAPSPGDKPVGDTPNAPAATPTEPAAQAAPVAEPVAAAAPATVTPSTEPQPDTDIAKALSDMRTELAVEKARADQVEMALREMRQIEAERVLTEHAKQFDAVAPVEDLMPILKAAAAAGPEAVAKFDEIFKAAAARITTVDTWSKQAGSNFGLFDEVGTAKQANPNGALGEIDSLAAELRKSDPNLSAEQARSRVLKQRPDLYKAYISDHPGVGRVTR